jgi:hypothetical protein
VEQGQGRRLERSPDGRIAYLAVGERGLDRWTIHLDEIDLEHGRPLGSPKLATVDVSPPAVPAPSSGEAPVDTYLDGPTTRLSPNGRQLLVLASVNPNTESGEPVRKGWLVDIAGSSIDPIGNARPVDGPVLDRLASCGWTTWLGPEELLTTCWEASDVLDQATMTLHALHRASMTVPVLQLDGRPIAGVSFDLSAQARVADPLIDVANRIVYFWEPETHVLHRLDLIYGTSAQIDVSPSRGATTAIATPVAGVEPLENLSPTWTGVSSDLALYATPQLVAEPGGTRLFAIGTAVGTAGGNRGWLAGSTGVWVFDTRTFVNVDHWPAAAAYTSIALSPDGRWLTAAGQGGVDVAGNPSGWDASVSIHDTVDGRLALQLGNLGESQVFTLP